MQIAFRFSPAFAKCKTQNAANDYISRKRKEKWLAQSKLKYFQEGETVIGNGL
jgi:hypothetical protein